MKAHEKMRGVVYAQNLFYREVDDRIRTRRARSKTPSVSMESLVNSRAVTAGDQKAIFFSMSLSSLTRGGLNFGKIANRSIRFFFHSLQISLKTENNALSSIKFIWLYRIIFGFILFRQNSKLEVRYDL